ncbi:peptide-methionine (S)-S-oxide reductase [Streptomyces sp. NPDC004074]|uniref:peptide-methionine (S)-S-oxide reductase n=1 Tax=unclassified Streptomyces TaxID=2593676 RepID=UPI0033A9985D
MSTRRLSGIVAWAAGPPNGEQAPWAVLPNSYLPGRPRFAGARLISWLESDDIGLTFRSAIFYLDEAQRRIAGVVITDSDTSELWQGKLVTGVVPAGTFRPTYSVIRTRA